MAADRREITVTTVGGKGSSLSSSSIFSTAHSRCRLRIDSSSLDRFSNPTPPPILTPHIVSFPPYVTLSESRASLTVLLNKLILLAGSPNLRPLLPHFISQTLNSIPQAETLQFDPVELTGEEVSVMKNSSATLFGILALLDYQSAGLAAILDLVAALSCEVSGADVGAFNLTDSGDGNIAKEEIGVASDMKVFLNGSKMVGKSNYLAVSEIPKIHGSLREIVKLVHSKTRVYVNEKTGESGGGAGEAVATVVSSLAAVLRFVGERSLCRAKMNLDFVGNKNLVPFSIRMFEEKCPSWDSLRDSWRKASEASFEDDYERFVHEVNALMGIVWKIVVWEAVTAFVAIEGVELGQKEQGSEANEENVKAEKKKKKKVGLGKGTSVGVQLIKDRLQSKGGDGGDSSVVLEKLLEKCVDEIFSFLDPKEPEFDSLLDKVKEIVESNESRRIPKLPKGTRDFAKEDMAIREQAFSIITGVFKRHGATALDTPVFELRETLMGKYGEDSKLIYDLADQGGELCSLRYDLTVPFARYVAANKITSFRRYQIAKVYRRDNPSKGRFREFYQCDFDIAGQYERMGPDFEVIKILTELLDELDIGDYEVKLNHRKLLDGMLQICGVPPEKFRTICSSIDKLDKQPFEQIKREMVEEKGLNVETADKIGTFVKERGHPLELLSKLKEEGSSFLENNESVIALEDLEILFNALEKSKCVDKVVFDLSLARGLDYYTGMIFEAVFKGAMQVGSIAAGGRYDNLIGMFGSKQVPAVGVSLGIERVFTIMTELQQKRKQTIRATETQVLVSILWDDLSQAAELASELWNAGLKAEYMVNKRRTKHFDHARESKIPWMVLVGERELNEGVVKLKDMEAAEEKDIPRNQVVEELKKRLSP